MWSIHSVFPRDGYGYDSHDWASRDARTISDGLSMFDTCNHQPFVGVGTPVGSGVGPAAGLVWQAALAAPGAFGLRRCRLRTVGRRASHG